MLKVSVGSHYTFEYHENAPDTLDSIEVRAGAFHLIKNSVSYTAEVVRADYTEKLFVIKVNGFTYEVKVADRFDLLLQQLGMNASTQSQIKDLKAPMPGLILDIKVTTGQAVQKGDPLIILEAMKMENIIKDPADGTVQSIKIKKGDSVEKSQVLMTF